MRWLVSLSLRQAVVVLTLAVIGALAAARSARTIPLDVFPEFAPPLVEIQTEAPGLSTPEVESLVSVPIESALAGVPGVKIIRSKSVLGLSSVVLILNGDADLGTDGDRLGHAERRRSECIGYGDGLRREVRAGLELRLVALDRRTRPLDRRTELLRPRHDEREGAERVRERRGRSSSRERNSFEPRDRCTMRDTNRGNDRSLSDRGAPRNDRPASFGCVADQNRAHDRGAAGRRGDVGKPLGVADVSPLRPGVPRTPWTERSPSSYRPKIQTFFLRCSSSVESDLPEDENG